MSDKPAPDGGVLRADNISLRLVNRDDSERLRRWRGRDDVRIWFEDTRKIDSASQSSWMGRYLAKDDDSMFIISLNEDGEEWPVGTVALYDIDRETGFAEYGRVMIGEDVARGRSVAERASQTLCDWALGDLGLRRIVLWVLQTNHRAIAIYNRLGFKQTEPEEPRDGYLFMVLENKHGG